jgi:YcxB-like protein
MDPVILEFQFSESEYKRAVRRTFAVGMLVPVVLYVLAGVLFKEIIWFCALALIFVVMLTFLLPNRLWNATPGIKENRQYVFSEEGLSVHSLSADARLSWATQARSREYGEHYALRGQRRGVLVIVPKRAFTRPEDQVTFRTLLRSHTHAKFRSTG